MSKHFKDRTTAGKELAKRLTTYKDDPNSIILALPRGGVPVAYEIASFLNLPMDLFMVRKIGFPGNEEYAMGAITINNETIFNVEAATKFAIDSSLVLAIIARESAELTRRNELYRQGKPMPELKSKRVILVDDGVATGATIKAVLVAIGKFLPKEIVLAVPVLPKDTLEELSPSVSKIVYLDAPEPFYAVGNSYVAFPQVTDSEVIELINKAKKLNN
jgi:predicted phosphoribosyltransferase